MSTSAIEVHEAFRIHDSSGARSVALQGLSLRVAEGEIVVVLGPSGSGKTTLLRVIAGFDELSAGSAKVLGTDLRNLGGSEIAGFRSANLGLLDQHYAQALSPDLSCLHTVALGLELLGNSPALARDAAAGLLERVGLAGRMDARPDELSGGEQQRVAVCAALAHRPRLLLADEPAGELDYSNAEGVYNLISELVRGRSASALIVSHDDLAAEIADRLVYVRDGRVVEEMRRGEASSLVVSGPGWIRVPDPLLASLGNPDRLSAEMGEEGAVVLRGVGVLRQPGNALTREEPPPSEEVSVVAALRNVVKSFPGSSNPVVNGLSWDFESHTFTAITGRSGSGKTTVLHLLAGLDLPTSGEVRVLDSDIVCMTRSEVAQMRRESVELVTQEPGLVPHLSAVENVELSLQIRGLAGDLRRRAEEALLEVGLGSRLAHRSDRLSAGERQRVAIARALAAKPAILIADEPSARLDRANAHAVGEILRALSRNRGTAVVCATHDDALIEQADVNLQLSAGQQLSEAVLR